MIKAMTAAAAGAGLLTLGAYASGACIAGVLGPCPDKKNIARNSRNIQATIARLATTERKWEKLATQTDEKFFVVANDIKQLHQNQQALQRHQRELWNATHETINGLTQALHKMNICTEFLFTRSQLNLLRTTLTSRLHIVHASLQGFRAALWAYRATLLDAIPGLALGLLPMSLVPRATLLQILDDIHLSQARSNDHLTLALSIDNLLRYYETPLVRRAESTTDGLLLTLGIPLTTRELILDVFKATLIPMLRGNNGQAQIWNIETDLIAVSHRHTENALLTQEQLNGCTGPDEAAVCQQGFATTRNRASCLASLFFHTTEQANSVCEYTMTRLPKVESAQSLGFGRWLITRRSDAYTFNLLHIHQSSNTNLVKGCKVCIITLACGTELETATLSLRADQTSCNLTGARRLDLQLPMPLQQFVPPPQAPLQLQDFIPPPNATYFPKIVAPQLPPIQGNLCDVKFPAYVDNHQPQPPHITTRLLHHPAATRSTYRTNFRHRYFDHNFGPSPHSSEVPACTPNSSTERTRATRTRPLHRIYNPSTSQALTHLHSYPTTRHCRSRKRCTAD